MNVSGRPQLDRGQNNGFSAHDFMRKWSPAVCDRVRYLIFVLETWQMEIRELDEDVDFFIVRMASREIVLHIRMPRLKLEARKNPGG
jgi:hypothetical protein